MPQFVTNLRNLDREGWLKLTVVIIGLIGYIAEGINTSVISPLFPVEAEKKGANHAQIGLVTGIFDAALAVSAFVLSAVNRPQTQKYFYCSGLLVSAICVALFGTLDYGPGGNTFIIMCTLTRMLMGYGASCVYASTVPITTQRYEHKYAARITAIVQTALGIGVVIGPPFGSFFYFIGGYTLPFYCAAGFEIALSIVAISMIPGYDPNAKYITRKMDFGMFFKFITTKELWITSLPLIALCSVSGFRDASFSTYLTNFLDVSEDAVGLIFLAISIAFSILAPIYGYFIEKGYVGWVMLFGLILMPVSLVLLYLPKQVGELQILAYVIPVLVINGCALATAFGPGYLMFENIAVRQNLTDDRGKIRLMVAGWYSVCRSGARTFGAFILGGVLQDAVGFYNVCIIFAVVHGIISVVAIVGCIYLGFFKKVFYLKSSGEYDLTVQTAEINETDSENESEPLLIAAQPIESDE